ncbi:MAG: type II toxin-antitoxin system HigB family toxin [Desulfomicrobium sp.]|nr:type II toxin-antitoxin system HigB family toxin [Desulfomicrobium sp.]
MNILSRKTLNCYCEKYAQARGSLLAWYDLVSKKRYSNHAELKDDFPGADYVGKNRYVFNIKGNDFRLIVSLSFQAGLGYVKWFGTHAEYGKIKAVEVKYDDPCH